MTATDELLRLLDEFEHECFTLRVEATETKAKDKDVREAYERIREESAQAIATTLGGGKLTAEQVRELIAPHLDARPTFDFGRHGAVWRADFQAIADELSAKFERGECERVKHGTKPDGTPRYRCSVCGYGLGDYRWAYCPKCGREIKDGAE